MNQPDLGMIVAELRIQKGLTQEKLAEDCEVSTRTIQRIEIGEVNPRAFTLNNLSNILEYDFNEENNQNETTWLTLLHLSCIFGLVLVPLVIWTWKKKKSQRINKHSRLVLNFQITILLLLMLAMFPVFILPGVVMFIEEISLGAAEMVYMFSVMLVSLPVFAIGIFSIYQGVMNASRMLADKPVYYRMSIPFLK